jgi:hypothetical protein
MWRGYLNWTDLLSVKVFLEEINSIFYMVYWTQWQTVRRRVIEYMRAPVMYRMSGVDMPCGRLG